MAGRWGKAAWRLSAIGGLLGCGIATIICCPLLDDFEAGLPIVQFCLRLKVFAVFLPARCSSRLTPTDALRG